MVADALAPLSSPGHKQPYVIEDDLMIAHAVQNICHRIYQQGNLALLITVNDEQEQQQFSRGIQ